MPFTVRPAERADIDAAAGLWRLLQDEHERADPRIRRSVTAEKRWRNDFKTWVRSRAHGILVADADGELVGLLTAHPHWPAPVYEQRYEIYINELIVVPEWRGRGVGLALVEAIREWSDEQGAALLRAGVLHSNADAVAFWRRVGARELFTTFTLSTSER